MKNFLQKRIIPGFLINVIIVILLGLVSYEKFENDMATTRLEEQKGTVLFHTEKIKSVLCDLENNSKGYLLTGNLNYLLDYTQKTFSLGSELEEIDHIAITNPWLAKYQEQLSALMDRKIDDNNLIIEEKKEGKAINFLNLMPSDKADLDKIVSLLNGVQSGENNYYLREKKRRAVISRELRIAFNALQFIVIFLLVAVYFII